MPLNQEKNRVATDPAWLAEPELPRAEEIMAREPQALPHNEVEAPPESKARYLESQYRLLRYEGTELLRRAVQEFREDPDMEESRSTAIYTNVSSNFLVAFMSPNQMARIRISRRYASHGYF